MNKLPTRQQVSVSDKWDVESLYSSDQAWERDFDQATANLSQITKFKNKINTAARLKSSLEVYFDWLRQIEKIYVYAHLKLDEDTTNANYQDFHTRAKNLHVKFMEQASFLQPEIIKLGPAKIKNWLADDSTGLKSYRKTLLDLIDEAKHLLSDREMELLAGASSFGHAPATIFSVFSDADLKFPTINNDKGQPETLTASNFITFMQSNQRPVRHQAYEAMYQTIGQYQNTLAATLQASIQRTTWYARNLKFTSNRAYRLFDARVPEAVYDNLIQTVHANLNSLHDYTQLRKTKLGVDQLYFYDNYCPLAEFDKKFSFDEAKSLIIEALKPMGEDYLAILQQAFDDGWIDKFENANKRSGAYSSGCYDSKPFILLNFKGNLESVFTLAHELGHSIHSYYSNSNQPYHYADYHIFVAEVASIVSEILLIKYLIKKSTNLAEKQFLINYFLDFFRGTVFRQTMFAEFELEMNRRVEAGESLTSPTINQFYQELNRQYFGPAMESDDLISLEWARIPHFYSPFYVYQYATGFAAATALSEQILTEGASAVDRYKQFLKSGSSQHPIKLLKTAGVDMTSPAPAQTALDQFKKLLGELD